MHDIKFIRENPEAFDAALAKRDLPARSAEILALDKEKRGGQTTMQQLQEEANKLAKQIGELMQQGKKAEAGPLLERSKQLKAQLAEAKDNAEAGEGDENTALVDILSALPNRLLDAVPKGKDENDNKELRRWGKPRQFSFIPKAHYELGEALKFGPFSQMETEQSAKISGSRFTSLFGGLARLERALGDFMLDVQTEQFGYTEVSPPLLVKDNAVFGTGQLPKFKEDLFHTEDGRWLIPTAEVSLTNLVADSILDESLLPLRLTARTPCFRSEAGSAGKDTRGYIRQHQFYKVELVSITTPEQSEEEHDRLSACAESVLQQLELPYRVLLLCSGDTGFGSIKTYDLEVWLPGQNAYREISSCSQCGDFQARRMKARYRPENGKENRFVYTLNGSGLAVGRTLVAVMENYQQEDGSILVPDVLRPYMKGMTAIR